MNSKKRKDVKFIAADVKVLKVAKEGDGGNGEKERSEGGGESIRVKGRASRWDSAPSGTKEGGQIEAVVEGLVGVVLKDFMPDKEDDILVFKCFRGDKVTVVDVCGKPAEAYFRSLPPDTTGYAKVRKDKEYISGWIPLNRGHVNWETST